jgi:ABC-type transport system involved in multi-copper enzyme maturation permease subunit
MFESPPWTMIGISLIVLAAWNATAFLIGVMRFCTRDFKS